jgi:hypothetical protein
VSQLYGVGGLWLASVVAAFSACFVLSFHFCDGRIDPYAADPWFVAATYGVVIALLAGTILFGALLALAFAIARMVRGSLIQWVTFALPVPFMVCALYAASALTEPVTSASCRL